MNILPVSLIVPGTAREDIIRKPMIGTPRPPVIHLYTGGPISGSRGQAGTGEMGQQHDGTVMTVTVKTICDGSAERADPYSTSQGAATGKHGGYSGLV